MPEDGDGGTTISYLDLIRATVGAAIPTGSEGTTDAVDEVSQSAVRDALPQPLKELASNPVTYIMGVVLTWVVSQIWNAGKSVIAAVLLAGDAIADLLIRAGNLLVYPFIGGGGSVLSILGDIQAGLLDTVTGLGLAAPAATTLLVGVEMLVLLFLADTLGRTVFAVGSSLPIIGPAFAIVGSVYRATSRALGALRRAIL